MATKENVRFTGRPILCVGIACLDIVTAVKSFPEEDTDSRSALHRWQRGGNPSNSCTVLANLGVPCELLATISVNSDNPAHLFVENDLRQHGISIDHCVFYKNHGTPTSVIIVSEEKGSRTILHHRGTLPELNFSDFKKIDLGAYKWIHFEGRNFEEYRKMLECTDKWNSEHCLEEHITVSVELEKHKPGFESLIPLADVIFISKDIASLCGFKDKVEVVKTFSKQIKKGATVICPWGEDGVAASTSDGDVTTIAAHRPVGKVVDTLGAGDTFIASTIYALSEGKSLHTALLMGCHVAGEKCAHHGYDCIKQFGNIVDRYI